MKEKECYKCKKVKSINNFTKSKKHPSGYHSWCKQCVKEYDKIRNANNAEKRKKQIRDRKKYLREWVSSYKANLKCKNCEENHISCLEFHHKDPSKKEGSLSDLIARGFSIKKLKEEIKKCDCLCSNCHRKLHWEENHNFNYNYN